MMSKSISIRDKFHKIILRNDRIMQQGIVVQFLFPLCCLLILTSANFEYKHRMKRRVVFSKSSKFFFRVNGKDNVVNYTEIFAHGWTIRVNYDLPETIPKRHQFFKRDVHAELDPITDEPTQNVFSCVRKFICENVNALKETEKCGFLCGIGRIIQSAVTIEAEFFKDFLINCDYHSQNCPYLIQDSKLGFG